MAWTLFLLLAILPSCENKWPDNGAFDGMWQLMEIDDGTSHSIKDQKLYWCVRTNLIQFTNAIQNVRMFAHFDKRGDRLLVYDLCYYSDNANPNDDNEWIPFEKRDVLYNFGINAVEDKEREGRICQTFIIKTLTSKALVLSDLNNTYTLTFRKF